MTCCLNSSETKALFLILYMSTMNDLLKSFFRLIINKGTSLLKSETKLIILNNYYDISAK